MFAAHLEGRESPPTPLSLSLLSFSSLLISLTQPFHRLDLIDILLEEGADPTVVDSNQHSAYKIAEFHNQERVMERFADDTPVARFGF